MWDRLKTSPIRRYFLYRALAMTWAFAPFQVYFLQRRGLSVSDVFDLNVVFCVAAVALEVPTGIFADRHGRRLAMSAGGFVMTLACGLFVIGTSFWAFAMANVLCALSMTLGSGADSAFLYDHLEHHRQSATYARFEGWSTAAKGLGNLLAVLLGALIYQYVLPEGVFVFTGLITALAGFLALSLPEHRAPSRGVATDHLSRAFRRLMTDGRLLPVVAFGAVAFVLLRLSLFADQPHLESHLTGSWLSHTVLTMGLLAGAKEVATASVAGSSGWLLSHLRVRHITAALALGLVASYALMGLDHGILCTTVMVLLASAFGLFSPLMRTLMNRLIPSGHDRATLLSFEGMGRRLLFAAASPLFGRAAEASSLHTTFSGTAWVAGCALGVLGVCGLLAFRRAPAAASMTVASRQASRRPSLAPVTW